MRLRRLKLEGGGELIQIYTGNGKGKTTAALGLALRAVGAGFKVYIGQFIKGGDYSELKALRSLDRIKIEQYGRGCFITKKQELKDIIMAKAGLNKARAVIRSNRYRLVILDEINVALKLKLISIDDVLGLLDSVKADTELVLTGRYLHPKMLKRADLVSEIKEKKHYYTRGIKARRGIEC